ncbi:hypothetical protein ABIB68_007219 [Bradyrhizobium sp. F1.2.2]
MSALPVQDICNTVLAGDCVKVKPHGHRVCGFHSH